MGIGLGKQALFIFLLPIWIIVRIFLLCRKNRNEIVIRREIILNIFFIYILNVLAITLFPLEINWSGNQEKWISINIVPVFYTLKDVLNITHNSDMHNFMVKFWIRNIFGNLFMLFPLGIILPLLWNNLNRFKRTLLLGLCLSLSIETIQLLSGFMGNRGRIFDIDDIILNTIGVALGFVLYRKWIKNLYILKIYKDE
jgi:glycopeptide antibiotics resistance protein